MTTKLLETRNETVKSNDKLTPIFPKPEVIC